MPESMPQQRALMNQWFGNPVDDKGPWEFLMARGWTDKAGLIVPPVSAHNPSPYELECIWFLCDEWDYAYEGSYRIIRE